MNIFVVTHIEPKLHLPSGYQYIGVGSLGFEGVLIDSTGHHISDKNSYYCELTALYWIWKNFSSPRSDAVGLVHYRRALALNNWMNVLQKKYLSEAQVADLLAGSDLILPQKVSFPNGIYAQYMDAHDIADLDRALDYVSLKYPNVQSYIDKFVNQKYGYIYNIFIARRDLFDEYCEWLFDILFSIEPLVNPSQKLGYQRRVMGFLAERLINLWLMTKPHIRITEAMILRTDKSGFSNLNRLRRGAI